ncbi:isocitrate lyase/phosphoenolpyruvate mutase family protein [Nonomuraea sp. NPDC050310]|uniref:isocitrate lyase/PEP mutase family protein n=1 Tax=Nonomuraea sp. NPDC050310 TaxID=3154935 RepID=UPI0033E82E8E
MTAASPAQAFALLHRPGDPLVLPNAWDYASAALLAAHGFPAVATTSLGVAAVHGLPDGQEATRDQAVALAGLLTRLPVLVTVDAENGYSDDPAKVAELVTTLRDLGVAGVNLEDGKPDGTLRDVGHQREILAAACGQGVFVNARTDTCWLGTGDTLERAEAYALADGLFVPGLTDPEAVAAVVAVTPRPLNVLYQPGGPSVAELAAAGAACISMGSLLYRAALRTALATVLELRGEPAPALPTAAEIVRMLAEPR